MINPTISIRNALETALASISPAIDIVHENEAYEPVVDVPYCESYVLFAKPGNPTVGDGYYCEQGVFQVNLQYPPKVGTLDVALRTEQLRTLFKRGATFADGGVTVQIDETPDPGNGAVEGDRWKVVVRVRWHADIFAA